MAAVAATTTAVSSSTSSARQGAAGAAPVAWATSVDVDRTALPLPLVVVRGRLDTSGAALLSAVLTHVTRTTAPVPPSGRAALEVDLSAVTFADRRGLHLLLDGAVSIRAASSAVWEVLEALTGGAPPGAAAGRHVPHRREVPRPGAARR